MTTEIVTAEMYRAIGKWPAEARFDWNERAAIRQYDGKLPRAVAEREAYADIAAGVKT